MSIRNLGNKLIEKYNINSSCDAEQFERVMSKIEYDYMYSEKLGELEEAEQELIQNEYHVLMEYIAMKFTSLKFGVSMINARTLHDILYEGDYEVYVDRVAKIMEINSKWE